MATAEDAKVTAAPAQPVTHTYHCICTSLVLATTTELATLPKRRLDKSSICQLPPSPSPDSISRVDTHYALLLSTVPDRSAVVIRLEDGFEKRYLQRCGRCKVVVGYHLDLSQYEESKDRLGKREDVVYLLPGGLLNTGDMQLKRPSEKDVQL